MIGSCYRGAPRARRPRLSSRINRPGTRTVTTLSARAKVFADGSRAALPFNVSAPVRVLYREVEDEGGDSLLAIRGSRVAVEIKVAFPPALGAYVDALRRDGLKVIRTVPDYGLVEGTVPVARLPAVAQLAAHVWPAPRLS